MQNKCGENHDGTNHVHENSHDDLKAWEQLKAAQRSHEEKVILNSLKHIQGSIAGLEQKRREIKAMVQRV